MLPVALHNDKRTHANHSGPKSPAWLKVHLKIHTRISRNVLERQRGTKVRPAEILFSISVCCFCPMKKLLFQQFLDQMGGIILCKKQKDSKLCFLPQQLDDGRIKQNIYSCDGPLLTCPHSAPLSASGALPPV